VVPKRIVAPDSQSNEVAVISKTNWYVVVAVLFIVTLLIGLLVVSNVKGPVSQIRIRNSTDRNLESVEVGRGHYGSIAPGAVSEYQAWGPAYKYARVSSVADGKLMLLQPIDNVGETPLGPGRFTYILSLRRDSEKDSLVITLVRD
jgi:hypothetical protein